MDTHRHHRLAEIFLIACELEPYEQAAYLEEACRTDPALRWDVDALLAADARRGAFLDDVDSEMPPP